MIVEIEKLVKRYHEFLAVDNVSFQIKEGDIFGLLGPNGAGKTTTINAILGLVKIDGGTIRVFGKNMLHHDKEIKKDLGFVPQDIAIYEDLKAIENVTMFGKLYGLRGSDLKDKVHKALEFTGLIDRKNDFPKKFSGGMKRRLNIACAIVHQPKLIIMDEPTVGIDPQSRNHILDSIQKLNEQGSTIIYTSHYMEEVETLCNNITIIDHGKVIANGTKSELKELVSTEERVVIEVDIPNYTAYESIKHLSGVKDCIISENQINVISKKNSGNLSKIIDCINSVGSEIISINLEKPTLESVFLELTGRSLRD